VHGLAMKTKKAQRLLQPRAPSHIRYRYGSRPRGTVKSTAARARARAAALKPASYPLHIRLTPARS